MSRFPSSGPDCSAPCTTTPADGADKRKGSTRGGAPREVRSCLTCRIGEARGKSIDLCLQCLVDQSMHVSLQPEWPQRVVCATAGAQPLVGGERQVRPAIESGDLTVALEFLIHRLLRGEQQ